MSRLLNLHEAAGSMARNAPDLLAEPEVARALEQALIHAIIGCVGDEEADQYSISNRHHRIALARLEQLLAEKANTQLHLAEICGAIGVPERTLRVSCQKQLGMGPIRYLWLRRMHLARGALLKADASKTTGRRSPRPAVSGSLESFSGLSLALRGVPGRDTAARSRSGSVPSGSALTLPAAVSA
jgi:AraC-like DNA-binding protein